MAELRCPTGCDARPSGKNDPHLALRATEDEISTVKQRLVERDVEVRESRTSIYFHDPDGNFLELTHWNGLDSE